MGEFVLYSRDRMGILAVILEGFFEVSAILQSGVYALVYRREVVYVGKSKMMLQRIIAHRSKSGRLRMGGPRCVTFDGVWVLPAPVDHLDSLERKMINRYKPRYNKMLKNNLPPDIAELIATLIPQVPQEPRIYIRRRL